jgi:hypothetical protein
MNVNSRKKKLQMLLLAGISSSGFCSELNLDYIKEGHALAEVGGYGGIEGKAQHINIETRIGNDFTVNSTSGGNVLVGLGYEHLLKKNEGFGVSCGLSLFYLAPSTVNGNILLENQLTNFAYSYKVSHLPLYGMLKASHELQNTRYQLLADVGIGPNFMFLNDYKETPLLVNSVPDNAFLSTNATTFSVTAGLGFEVKNVFGAYPLRCGYRFYYLGEGALNHNNKVENSLSTGSTYANAGVCSVVF